MKTRPRLTPRMFDTNLWSRLMLGRRRLTLAVAMIIGLVALAYVPAEAQSNISIPANSVDQAPVAAPQVAAQGGEANLKIPDLNMARFFNDAIGGHTLLTYGLIVCALGVVFGLVVYVRLKNLPVHSSMLEVSELIYATCKTYLLQQGKFLLMLWGFIALVIAAYFGYLNPIEGQSVGVTLPMILVFSLLGMGGSYAVAAFGMRVNTFANSRTAFAALKGKPFPCYDIPLQAGMSIGMMLGVDRTDHDAGDSAVCAGKPGGAVLHRVCDPGSRCGRRRPSRVAGGIFTKIADIGADLMKIVFKIKEDDARNPGVIAGLHGGQCGRLGQTGRRRMVLRPTV